MIDLDELERAAREATPGEWRRNGTAIYAGRMRVTDVQQAPGYIGSPDFHNSRFIALANPAAVLELVARVRAAEAENGRLRTALEEIAAFCESPDWTHEWDSADDGDFISCDGRWHVEAIATDALVSLEARDAT